MNILTEVIDADKLKRVFEENGKDTEDIDADKLKMIFEENCKDSINIFTHHNRDENIITLWKT